ncbi:hypothetical protein AVEN_273512-1 [Araneus ventricosus]|uniref:Uncharacterized protein n=1 Tax=Araneus ventricosus TaxID=182803 RepID=A0A4Y2H3I8_ARAVE|nr:hypothetical protein AVEN_273512-1 [Araneus ventricosus]
MYAATVQGDSPCVKSLLKLNDNTKPSQPKPAVHVKHNTEHHIETRGSPVFSKARRLGPGKLWNGLCCLQTTAVEFLISSLATKCHLNLLFSTKKSGSTPIFLTF